MSTTIEKPKDMKFLRWTRNKPKIPGWYWMSAPGYCHVPRMVHVWISGKGLFVSDVNQEYALQGRHWKGFKWAGPIIPPDQQ